MNNNQSSPNAISHKKLNALLKKAKKEILSIETSENNENKEFNEVIQEWTIASKKVLLILNKKDKVSIKTRDTKSLMAFGAMAAHINMALQALDATELDNWRLNSNKFIK